MNAQIAGCGKSFFLQVFRNYLEAKAKKSKLHENFMKVAAPTGTAAFNVNGGVQIKSICTYLCTVILLILLFHHCRDPAFIVSVAHKHESKVSFSFKYVLYCFPSTMQWWFFPPPPICRSPAPDLVGDQLLRLQRTFEGTEIVVSSTLLERLQACKTFPIRSSRPMFSWLFAGHWWEINGQYSYDVSNRCKNETGYLWPSNWAIWRCVIRHNGVNSSYFIVPLSNPNLSLFFSIRDYGQLPPVKGKPLYDRKQTRIFEAQGKQRYDLFDKCIQFDVVMRQVKWLIVLN